MLITVPVGNATEAFVGIVTVTLEAFEQVTFLPASVRTNVYVVPVWALIPLPAYETASTRCATFRETPGQADTRSVLATYGDP
jgi:hypothetical protein